MSPLAGGNLPLWKLSSSTSFGSGRCYVFSLRKTPCIALLADAIIILDRWFDANLLQHAPEHMVIDRALVDAGELHAQLVSIREKVRGGRRTTVGRSEKLNELKRLMQKKEFHFDSDDIP